MMKKQITMRLLERPNIPVEAESITPENFSNKGLEQIYKLPLWCGNHQQSIGDYFEVVISHEETGNTRNSSGKDVLPKVVLVGDFSKFKRLGQGMTSGEMEIQGSVGFHAGAFMSGGSLHIQGNAGDWLGAHMRGGRIMVEGSVGHFCGSAYRGKTQGMDGGIILIKGNTGQMAGSRMRRGLMAIAGNCGDALGFKMLAGTILVGGKSGIRIGANMTRGSILLLQQVELLPTFYYNSTYQPVFWGLILKELQYQGFTLPENYEKARFKRYSGDALEGGKGEILICL